MTDMDETEINRIAIGFAIQAFQRQRERTTDVDRPDESQFREAASALLNPTEAPPIGAHVQLDFSNPGSVYRQMQQVVDMAIDVTKQHWIAVMTAMVQIICDMGNAIEAKHLDTDVLDCLQQLALAQAQGSDSDETDG